MGFEIKSIIDQIEKEKKIKRKEIIEVLKEALLKAAEKSLGKNREFEIYYDDETGNLEIIEKKVVVKEVKVPEKEISIEEAKKYVSDVKEGDILELRVDKKHLGRIGAYAARDLLINKLGKVEADTIYNEYTKKLWQIVEGKVKKVDKDGNVIVDLSGVEGLLKADELIPKEKFRPNDDVKALVISVTKDEKKSLVRVLLSRTHPEFVRRLFEKQVTEIADGKVEIKGIAREPGVRTKIAVYSSDPDIDPVGACVGMKGARVQTIVQELRGEKIDIIPWSPDPQKFVARALSPAHISRVTVYEDEKMMEVVVPDDQHSLAIGKKGHNVRLAKKLTGWEKIQIRSESEIEKMKKEAYEKFGKLPGVGQKTAEFIFSSGYNSILEIAKASVEDLIKIPGITRKEAEEIIKAAKEMIESESQKSGEEKT
jgi:N utilization substance protein A